MRYGIYERLAAEPGSYMRPTRCTERANCTSRFRLLKDNSDEY